jgi:hypothetical protein
MQQQRQQQGRGLGRNSKKGWQTTCGKSGQLVLQSWQCNPASCIAVFRWGIMQQQ